MRFLFLLDYVSPQYVDMIEGTFNS